MKKIVLIHWNAAEAAARVQALSDAGFEVILFTGGPPTLLRDLGPDAFIIDLTRIPSQGQAVAISIRQQKTNRFVPLVFAGGAPEKTERIQALLPDASFTTWENILATLQSSVAHPPSEPVVPGTFDPYAGAALPKKLGIRAGSQVLLYLAPEGFQQLLGALPENTRLFSQPGGLAQVVLFFARSQQELTDHFSKAAGTLSPNGKLWILWQKKTSKMSSDLDHKRVQKFGLDAGFMDYKICAVDETWSGLCFTRKKG